MSARFIDGIAIFGSCPYGQFRGAFQTAVTYTGSKMKSAAKLNAYFPPRKKQPFLSKAVHLVGQEFQQRKSSVVCFKPSGSLGRGIYLFSSVVKVRAWLQFIDSEVFT